MQEIFSRGYESANMLLKDLTCAHVKFLHESDQWHPRDIRISLNG